MKFVIHGATGAQGSPLVARLTSSGKKVVAAVRNTAAVTGAPAVAVDYGSVDSLTAAYRDADGIFLHLPVASPDDRQRYARNVVEAVSRAKPGRVVISTSGYGIGEPGSPLQASSEDAVPTLVSGAERAGVSVAVIAPRLYLENLLAPFVFERVKSDGVLRYPLRADYPVSWSSHLDVADVAAKLLTETKVTGVVGVGQLPPITGTQLAEGFARHLGRKVTYEAVTPEAFGEILAPLFGAAAAAGVVAGYRAREHGPADAITDQTSAQRLLGLTPRTVPQWLAELGM